MDSGDSLLPKYERVTRKLRAMVLDGSLATGHKFLPEPELAAELGVSRKTIRRAMQALRADRLVCQMKGRGTFVTYASSAPARTIGVVGMTFDTDDPYFSLIQRGMNGVFSREGSHVRWMTLPVPSGGNLLDTVHRYRLDGLILLGPEYEVVREFCGLPHHRLPHVVVGVSWPMLWENNCVFVDADNIGGAGTAVRYLLELGHTRILWFGGDPGMASSQYQRLKGYRLALERAGLPVDDALVVACPSGGSLADREAALVARLKKPDPPTAVFAAGHGYALAALDAARCLRRRVPDELSVVGFDDNALFHHLATPLTTIFQPVERIGAKAAEMVLDQIFHRQTAERQVVMATRLIERTSCRGIESGVDQETAPATQSPREQEDTP